jgi:hypothetical protein
MATSNGSNNSQAGYSTAYVAAFPYLAAVNTAGQPAQQPAPLNNIPSGADAAGTEFNGVGIATSGETNPGTGIEPGGKSVTPAQYQTDLAATPNALYVSRAPQSNLA